MNRTTGRRRFLRAAGAVSAFGLASKLDLLHAIAEASAQSATEYRALVCVFMFGGNDGNNTVIPLDAGGYAQYAAVRPTSSGINLAQTDLLPITPANVGTTYGLHPALTGIQALFDAGRVAIALAF